MPIGPLTMLAIYLVCWWIVLFAILPLGMNQQAQERPEDGGQWGAPREPKLKKKFITTTWVSAIVWAVIMLVVLTGAIPLPTMIGNAAG
ncbi:MAG: DUF1467 family protein [Brevundimonas sp.]|uniref:DUF1467 family protein n=1 Tax=Brevundimonas sp. TaxID=1871086 RepID=UPI0025BECDCD|nr:DUF1467 family protein [Brevundimonas sp.]MBX3478656.1 DUF1467 family protein [Brevundimonas sp.]